MTENSSGRWYGELGGMYVMFAKDGQTGGSCGPLDDPERVAETIRDIRALSVATNAVVEGEMHRAGNRGGYAVRGAKVTLSDEGSVREAVTNRNGFFRFTVPPGRYVLDAGAAESSDYSVSRSGDIRLVAGQCAQLDLVRP